MALRFLVVEGNPVGPRERHQATFGKTYSDSYGSVLQTIDPTSIYDVVFPADEGANLPDSGGFESYDGVFLTGSALNAYHATPDILRQVDLMREVYRSGTPSFGSCWGLQMGAMAAGGDVQMNQKGREVGFARRITRTDEGTRHPMLQGRPMSFDAPAIHLDVVTTLPEHVTVLASNTVTPVQAAEIHHEGGVFWGVQYHPEFSLTELATILKRYHDTLLAEGMFLSSGDHAAYIDDLLTLESDRKRTDLSWRFGLDEEVLDDFKRLTEIRNFIEHYVKPKKSERGRA